MHQALVDSDLLSGGSTSVDITLGRTEGSDKDEVLVSLLSDMYGSVEFEDSELGVTEEVGDNRVEDEESGSDVETWEDELPASMDTEDEELYDDLLEWLPDEERVGPAPARARTPEPLGRGPISMLKLRQSVNDGQQKPKYFCGVCCRILFDIPGEVYFCRLSETLADNILMQDIEWPCYQYNTRLARKNQRIVACKTHRVIDQKALDFMAMLNGPWKNPLFVKGASRDQDQVWSKTPSALSNLTWADLPYLCQVMTFCGLQARGGPLMFPKVSGNVSLYNSRRSLTLGSGLASFLEQEDLGTADRDQIIAAWNFLVGHNRLYREYGNIGLDSADLDLRGATFVRDIMDEQRPVNVGQEAFGGFVIRGEDEPGPRAGDIAIEDVAVAIDSETEELVTFAAEDLMAKVFPELFPLGNGHFSLWHQKKKGRTQAQTAAARNQTWSLRDYCKYRLFHFDRTFARHVRFIVFCFDWINKMAVNGYRIRTTSSVREDGRATTMADIMRGGRLDKTEAIVVPSSVRCSARYKEVLRSDTLAMAREFKTPEIFGTWTVNMNNEAYSLAMDPDKRAVTDIPLFCSLVNREWHRVWTFIRKKWAPYYTGGLRASEWVMEFQDRGAPHMHFLAWTHKSVEELVEQNDEPDMQLVSCSSRSEEPDLQRLIDLCQRHAHTEDYCIRTTQDGVRFCRFRFPKDLSDKTRLADEGDVIIYRRKAGDEMINTYSPWLLLLSQSNQDIQLNRGKRAVSYLVKYVSKKSESFEGRIEEGDDHEVNIEGILRVDLETHRYIYSKVSLPEVVMDICSFDISRKSHKVLYLPTQHPNDRRRVVRRAEELEAEDMDSINIYYKDLWDKYLQRPQGFLFDNLTYEDFYREYHVVENPVRANIRNGPFDHELDPKIVYASGGGAAGRRRFYKRYERGHVAVVRHRPTPMTSVDDTCMHLLMLGMPTRTDCDQWLEFYSIGSFMDLANIMLPQAVLDTIVPMEQAQINVEEQNDLNPEQEAVVTVLMSVVSAQCNIVHGPAGTGKSTLLRALRNRLAQGGVFEPIVLSPTGVAAINIGGRTLHSFFGAKVDKGKTRLEPNLFDTDWNIHRIRAQGRRPYLIIDEASMLSAETLQTISDTLAKLAHNPMLQRRPFGGIRVCLFADFGQLGPVDSDDDISGWVWNASVFPQFHFYNLRTPCRQGNIEFFRFLSIVRIGPKSDAEKRFVQDILLRRDFRARGQVDYLSEDSHLTCLLARQDQVDAINNYFVSLHLQEVIRIKAIDNVQSSSNLQRDDLEDSTGFLAELVLWIGARVMITSNISVARGLVNGAIARVCRVDLNAEEISVDLESQPGVVQKVRPESRESKRRGYARNQFPLRLAYAITIHKAQGLTLPKVAFDLHGIFCSGQAYVAMSRVKRLEDLFTASVPYDIAGVFPSSKIRNKLQELDHFEAEE